MTTMHRMADYVDAALNDPAVIYAANDIISVARPRAWSDQIDAIRRYLDQTFRFVDNPVNRQRIQPVPAMLEKIQRTGHVLGACNDAADLVATLGMANGLPARFVAYAFCEQGTAPQDTPFSHVIADLFDGNQWQMLDITRPKEIFRLPCVARTLALDLQ